jgi:hypothetical protein
VKLLAWATLSVTPDISIDRCCPSAEIVSVIWNVLAGSR